MGAMNEPEKKVVLITSDDDLVDFPPEAWENCEKIVVSAEAFEQLLELLDSEERDLPNLRKLFARPSVFEKKS